MWALNRVSILHLAPPVARNVTLNVELEKTLDDSPSSTDEEFNSSQSVVDHLAAEPPANQHAGAGACNSVSLSRLPLLDRDVDLSPEERNTAQYNLLT